MAARVAKFQVGFRVGGDLKRGEARSVHAGTVLTPGAVVQSPEDEERHPGACIGCGMGKIYPFYPVTHLGALVPPPAPLPASFDS